MDITKTVEPKSDQQNFEDYISGPRTVTVSDVKQGPPEQPVHLHLVEYPGRPYKPGKSMRRVLIAAWGVEASAYKGRRMTLFGDPTIKFGGQAIGGIRIAALSDITEPLEVLLTVTRGKRAPFVVQPLTDAPAVDESVVVDMLAMIASAESIPALKTAWDLAGVKGVQKHPDVIAAKDKRKAELAGAES